MVDHRNQPETRPLTHHLTPHLGTPCIILNTNPSPIPSLLALIYLTLSTTWRYLATIMLTFLTLPCILSTPFLFVFIFFIASISFDAPNVFEATADAFNACNEFTFQDLQDLIDLANNVTEEVPVVPT